MKQNRGVQWKSISTSASYTRRTRDRSVVGDYRNEEMVFHALTKLLAFAVFRVRGRNTAQGSQQIETNQNPLDAEELQG